jgi:hypothetical protein
MKLKPRTGHWKRLGGRESHLAPALGVFQCFEKVDRSRKKWRPCIRCQARLLETPRWAPLYGGSQPLVSRMDGQRHSWPRLCTEQGTYQGKYLITYLPKVFSCCQMVVAPYYRD